MTDGLDVFLKLTCELAEELIGGRYLLLKILLRAPDRVEALCSKLVEVFLKADEVALHIFKLYLVLIEVDLLLLGDFLAKRNLLVCLNNQSPKGLVLFVLRLLKLDALLSLLIIDCVDVVFQLLVTNFKFLNLFIDFDYLVIRLILATFQFTVLDGQIEKVLIATHCDQSWCKHRGLSHLIVVIDCRLWRWLVTHLSWTHCFENEISVHLRQAFFLSEAVGRACLSVQHALAIRVQTRLHLLSEILDAEDL